MPRVHMASNFLNSAEFRTGTSRRLISFLLYALILQRGASLAELNAVMDVLAAGATVQALAEGMFGSPEFNSGLE
jgi:hypothetical protein